MRRRGFTYLDNETKTKKVIKSVLKKKGFSRSVSGNAVSFQQKGMSPIHGIFNLKEEDRSTVVEMFITTKWWFHAVSLLATSVFFVFGAILYNRVDSVYGILAFATGMVTFGGNYFLSKVLEKKCELLLSHSLLLRKFI